MSSTLFAIYIDHFTRDTSLNCGINIGNINLSVLLFADDIVILAPTEEDLQTKLCKIREWYAKLRLKISTDKTNLIHFRPSNVHRSNFGLTCGNTSVVIQGAMHSWTWLDVVG